MMAPVHASYPWLCFVEMHMMELHVAQRRSMVPMASSGEQLPSSTATTISLYRYARGSVGTDDKTGTGCYSTQRPVLQRFAPRCRVCLCEAMRR